MGHVWHGRRSRWISSNAAILALLGWAREPAAVNGVIADPMMPFSTLLGGSEADFANAVAVAPDGIVWIVGDTRSPDFPGLPPGPPGVWWLDSCLIRIDPDQKEVLSTLSLGRYASPTGIAFDAQGNAFICGTGGGEDLPGNPGFRPVSAGSGDLFIQKVAADGVTALWSTYLGGSLDELAGDVAVASNGDVVVTGTTNSPDFPTKDALQGALQGRTDAFVARIRGDGSALVFSTYLGGSADYLGVSQEETATGVAIADDGGIVVCGSTISDDFPLVRPIQASRAGGFDGFVAKLDPSGATLEWATLIGGSAYDGAVDVAVDRNGAVVLLGETESADFPASDGPGWMEGAEQDVFVTRIADDGTSVERSIRYGGEWNEGPIDLSLAPDGTAWVTGWTGSGDLPTAGSVRCRLGSGDAFVAGFDLDAGALLFSTYLGGNSWTEGSSVALGPDDSAWVVGTTWATDFPLASPVQTLPGGDFDMFVTRLPRTDPARRPALPDGLEAAALSGHSVRLQWEDRSGNETGFAVDRSGNSYGFERVGVVPSGTSVFTDVGLLPARTYTYSVQAFNEDGGSAPSPEVQVATPSTLDARLLRWSQRRIRWSGAYRLRFEVSLIPNSGAAAEPLDPVGGGIEVRIRSEEYTGYGVWEGIRPDDPNWRKDGHRLVWRPRGHWWFGVEVDIRRGRMTVKGLTSDRLPITIPDQDVRMRVTVGTDAGAVQLPWPVAWR